MWNCNRQFSLFKKLGIHLKRKIIKDLRNMDSWKDGRVPRLRRCLRLSFLTDSLLTSTTILLQIYRNGTKSTRPCAFTIRGLRSDFPQDVRASTWLNAVNSDRFTVESRRKLVTQSSILYDLVRLRVSVFRSVNRTAHTWPSAQLTRTYRRVLRDTIAVVVHPGRVQGPVSTTAMSVCVCVRARAPHAYTQDRGGMYRTYTDAPPITLTCKYVICSSDSRYTWLHSVTSTDIESLHPTGSLLLEGEALSSSTCTSAVVTHAHAHTAERASSSSPSHHVASRSEGGTTETNHRRCERDARPDATGSKNKSKMPSQFSLLLIAP